MRLVGYADGMPVPANPPVLPELAEVRRWSARVGSLRPTPPSSTDVDRWLAMHGYGLTGYERAQLDGLLASWVDRQGTTPHQRLRSTMEYLRALPGSRQQRRREREDVDRQRIAAARARAAARYGPRG